MFQGWRWTLAMFVWKFRLLLGPLSVCLYLIDYLLTIKFLFSLMGKYKEDWLNEIDNDDYYEPVVQKIKKHKSNPSKKHKKNESRRKNKEFIYEEED